MPRDYVPKKRKRPKELPQINPFDIEEIALEMPEIEIPKISFQVSRTMEELLAEKARRSIEALRLYEPLPSPYRFHASNAPERIIRGGNRAGKTLAACVELARAVTGQDPHNKYPLKDGRCFVVGKDGRHLSQVLWRKLARAGAFKIIRDQETNLWRSYRPLDQRDRERIHETKAAPPLIPPRFIKHISWEEKKSGLPRLVTLYNGWEITFYSSLGEPPNGADIDLALFDEEIVNSEWYNEVSARLLDRKGRFIWSATPQAGTEQLFHLHERADELRGQPNPQVEEFFVGLADNPHIDEEQKDAFKKKLSDLDYAVRFEGDFALMMYKVFPEWSLGIHLKDWFNIPRHWTRYAVVDPGRQVCAAIFAAVPPPHEGSQIIVYDELYIRNCDAEQFGKGMADKTGGQRFQAFIIDHQGGRVHDSGSGLTVEHQYSAALKRYKVRSEATGHHFVWGDSNVGSGIESVRALLRVQESGLPKLQVFGDKCPNLLWEIKHYRYKRVKDQPTDKPEDRGRVHIMACLRYLAMYPTRYHVISGKGRPVGARGAFEAKMARKKEALGGSSVRLGPGR